MGVPVRAIEGGLKEARSGESMPARIDGGRKALRCPSGRLYSPGGCGCALLMAPVMAAGVALAALSLGLAALTLAGLALAIFLTVREVRRARDGAPARVATTGAIAVLYATCIPYLVLFAWFWFGG